MGNPDLIDQLPFGAEDDAICYGDAVSIRAVDAYPEGVGGEYDEEMATEWKF
ncbi:MAG: hypothetical protein QXD60_01025 [Nanopusillaceae archaeon]